MLPARRAAGKVGIGVTADALLVRFFADMPGVGREQVNCSIAGTQDVPGSVPFADFAAVGAGEPGVHGTTSTIPVTVAVSGPPYCSVHTRSLLGARG